MKNRFVKTGSAALIMGVLFGSTGLATLSGCDRQGPAERAGQNIDNAVDKVGDQMDKAGDKVRDAVN